MGLGRRETPSPEIAAGRSVALVDKSDGKLLEIELWQIEQPYEELRIRTPRQLAQITASLLHEGQRSPVIVVAGDEPSRYVLIDGHTRAQALRRSREDVARALCVPLGAAEALGWSYRLETGGR